MEKLLTSTELKAVLGVSRTTIDKAVRSGRLTVAARDGRGRPKFRPSVAIREWNQTSDVGVPAVESGKGGRPKKRQDPPPATSSLDIPVLDGQDFAILLEKLATMTPAQQRVQVDVIRKLRDARLAELKVRKEEGLLIAVEDVRKDGMGLATVLMGALNAMPDRLSQQFATMDDPMAIREMLRAEINRMAESIRQQCGADAPETAPDVGSAKETGK